MNTFGPMPKAYGNSFVLPKPGVMVHLSPPVNPPMLKGIKVHADNPFRFDFVLDQGDSTSAEAKRESNVAKADYLKEESKKLIKYFLASLTIPENDLWVNLSPYEKDRIIPSSFGLTEMGRDLLAEDYMLKQITASLIYPEDEVGKKFWKRIYEEAQAKYHTTNIPVNTFNKVWIVPEKAVVYENAAAGTAYVVQSKLKVMLEEDYEALAKNDQKAESRAVADNLNQRGITTEKGPLVSANQEQGTRDGFKSNALGSQIIREVVLPALETEINEGKNFAQLRQVYNSLILATWYKKKIKDSILSQVYSDKNKVAGVKYDKSVILSEAKDLNKTKKDSSVATLPQNDKEAIYQQYLQAFKKGVYNYIKEEPDPITQERIPRKYFSGGLSMAMTSAKFGSPALVVSTDEAMLSQGEGEEDKTVTVEARIADVGSDRLDDRLEEGATRSSIMGPETTIEGLYGEKPLNLSPVEVGKEQPRLPALSNISHPEFYRELSNFGFEFDEEGNIAVDKEGNLKWTPGNWKPRPHRSLLALATKFAESPQQMTDEEKKIIHNIIALRKDPDDAPVVKLEKQEPLILFFESDPTKSSTIRRLFLTIVTINGERQPAIFKELSQVGRGENQSRSGYLMEFLPGTLVQFTLDNPIPEGPLKKQVELIQKFFRDALGLIPPEDYKLWNEVLTPLDPGEIGVFRTDRAFGDGPEFEWSEARKAAKIIEPLGGAHVFEEKARIPMNVSVLNEGTFKEHRAAANRVDGFGRDFAMTEPDQPKVEISLPVLLYMVHDLRIFINDLNLMEPLIKMEEEEALNKLRGQGRRDEATDLERRLAENWSKVDAERSLISKLNEKEVKDESAESSLYYITLTKQYIAALKNVITAEEVKLVTSVTSNDFNPSTDMKTVAYLVSLAQEFLGEIDDTLMGRDELGMMKIRKERRSLDSIFRDIVKKTTESSQGKVKVDIEKVDKNSVATVGQVKFYFIVENLIRNAKQEYMKKGGGTITVTAKNVGQETIISIEDEAGGMKDEILAAFEALTEEDYLKGTPKQLETTKEDGNGIGLINVKKYVFAHGGKIHVRKTASGNGTIFEIRLPLVEVEEFDLKTGKVVIKSPNQAMIAPVSERTVQLEPAYAQSSYEFFFGRKSPLPKVDTALAKSNDYLWNIRNISFRKQVGYLPLSAIGSEELIQQLIQEAEAKGLKAKRFSLREGPPRAIDDEIPKSDLKAEIAERLEAIGILEDHSADRFNPRWKITRNIKEKEAAVKEIIRKEGGNVEEIWNFLSLRGALYVYDPVLLQYLLEYRPFYREAVSEALNKKGGERVTADEFIDYIEFHHIEYSKENKPLLQVIAEAFNDPHEFEEDFRPVEFYMDEIRRAAEEYYGDKVKASAAMTVPTEEVVPTSPFRELVFKPVDAEEEVDIAKAHSANVRYAEQNNPFFDWTENLSDKSGNKFLKDPNLDDTEKADNLAKAEELYRFQNPGFFKNAPIIQLNWLINTYQELSSWENVVRIYQSATLAAKVKGAESRTEFTSDHYVIGTYLLALNRSGRSQQVLSIPLEKIVPEEFIATATAYKNIGASGLDLVYLLKQFNLQMGGATVINRESKIIIDQIRELLMEAWQYYPENEFIHTLRRTRGDEEFLKKMREEKTEDDIRSLESEYPEYLQRAYEEYFDAYSHYNDRYPGINAVRILLYQGKKIAAQKLGQIVLETALREDNHKSFWVAGTLLELALINNDAESAGKLIPAVLQLANGGGEIDSLLEHLERWNHIEPQDLLTTVIPILKLNAWNKDKKDYQGFIDGIRAQGAGEQGIRESLIKGIESLKKEKDVTAFIDTIIFELTTSDGVHIWPGNWEKGTVSDIIISEADKRVAQKIIQYKPKKDDFDPSGGLGKSLAEIEDDAEADQWVDRYIELLFGLKNENEENGRRNLEILSSPEHILFDLIEQVRKLFKGKTTSEATSLTALAISGKADCRGTGYFKDVLLDTRRSFRLEQERRQEKLKEFKAELKKLDQGDKEAFENIDFTLKETRTTRSGLIQVNMYGPVVGETNKIKFVPEEQQKGPPILHPLLGLGMEIVQAAGGRNVVTIEVQAGQTLEQVRQEFGQDIQEVLDAQGAHLGFTHPYLSIETVDGKEVIIRKVENAKQARKGNRKFLPFNNSDTSVIDTEYKVIREQGKPPRIFHLIEGNHVFTVDKHYEDGKIQYVKIGDTWYNGTMFYTYNGGIISLEELERIKETGGIFLAKGIRGDNSKTGQVGDDDVFMEVSQHSDSERFKKTHRYSQNYIYVAGQPFFNPFHPEDMDKMIRALFSKRERQKFFDKYVTPLLAWAAKQGITLPPEVVAMMTSGDSAMNASQGNNSKKDAAVIAGSKTQGGIDFTANKTPLEIQNSGQGIKFKLDPAMLQKLQNAPGFVPVIINIQPMTNLRLFLGLNDSPKPATRLTQLSSSPATT